MPTISADQLMIDPPVGISLRIPSFLLQCLSIYFHGYPGSYIPSCAMLFFSQFYPNSNHSYQISMLEMSTGPTLTTIKLLIKEISTLSSSLSDSVPKGSKDDKIWSVINSEERDNPHETFNRRFDVMFAEDCRDSDGRLHHLRQGKLGINLVVSYLSKINWTGFPLDLVEIKLQRLITELKFLQ